MASNRYVRQNEAGDWEVVKEGHRRATARANTKSKAVARARELTRRDGGGEIRVLGKGGKIASKNTVSSRRQTRGSRTTRTRSTS